MMNRIDVHKLADEAKFNRFHARVLLWGLVILIFDGYALGGILVALSGKTLIEAYGWQSVFFAAGLPLLLIPLILQTMPESMPFLIKKERNDDVRRIVRKLAPRQVLRGDEQFVVPAE